MELTWGSAVWLGTGCPICRTYTSPLVTFSGAVRFVPVNPSSPALVALAEPLIHSWCAPSRPRSNPTLIVARITSRSHRSFPLFEASLSLHTLPRAKAPCVWSKSSRKRTTSSLTAWSSGTAPRPVAAHHANRVTLSAAIRAPRLCTSLLHGRQHPTSRCPRQSLSRFPHHSLCLCLCSLLHPQRPCRLHLHRLATSPLTTPSHAMAARTTSKFRQGLA